MGMHRRHLRIVDPCDVFEPRDRVELCAHCNKDVHDLSRMTEAQARRLLADSRNKAICVAYRSRPDGNVVFRPATSMAGWLATCLLLSACTGWSPAGEINLPGDVCFDASGNEVNCLDPAAGYEVRPSETRPTPQARRERSSHEVASEGTGCPVPGSAPVRPPIEVVEPQVEDDRPDGGDAGTHVRVNFAIDTTQGESIMGILVMDNDSVDRSGPYGRLKFRPTEALWSELADRVRQRRADRRARRRR
jgi:hypothetical protein